MKSLKALQYLIVQCKKEEQGLADALTILLNFIKRASHEDEYIMAASALLYVAQHDTVSTRSDLLYLIAQSLMESTSI